MNALRFLFPVFLLAILVAALSCEPTEYSDVPEIRFISFTPFINTSDSTMVHMSARMMFSFRDGKANFGIEAADSTKNTHNIFFIPYKKVHGVYDTISRASYGWMYRVLKDDKMERTGINKTIEGEISIDMDYFLPPPFDTIRYKFYILDRANNQSNIDSTRDIAVSEITM
jgi:hypothetical protein